LQSLTGRPHSYTLLRKPKFRIRGLGFIYCVSQDSTAILAGIGFEAQKLAYIFRKARLLTNAPLQNPFIPYEHLQNPTMHIKNRHLGLNPQPKSIFLGLPSILQESDVHGKAFIAEQANFLYTRKYVEVL
jgi:hypothetical protein